MMQSGATHLMTPSHCREAGGDCDDENRAVHRDLPVVLSAYLYDCSLLRLTVKGHHPDI